VKAVNGILCAQAAEDAGYFSATCGRALAARESEQMNAVVLRAYRWQYIISGAQHPHFLKTLGSLITDTQAARIQAALATLS